VPILLVGWEYRIQDLGSITDIPRAGTRARDEEVEEVIAQGVTGRRGRASWEFRELSKITSETDRGSDDFSAGVLDLSA
jgi:hypothetical protein